MTYKRILFVITSFVIITSLFAQDDKERLYLYPAFPNTRGHAMFPAERPKVEGWANERVSEKLNRGLVAQPTKDGNIYLGWRLLNSDNEDISFNIYRSVDNGTAEKLNKDPVFTTTDYVDADPVKDIESSYWVCPVVNGFELEASEKVIVGPFSETTAKFYKSIKFQGNYMPSRSGIAVADLNGDGNYDFVIKQPAYSIDPAGRPNTDGTTYKIEAYLSDGTFLWRKDLGPGIEPGIWYSPYIVYDFTGDGRAEVALKTAPGVERDPDGRVREGEERLTILDGMTGEEIAWAPWPKRDLRYGDYNRLNRNQMGMAYLDGKTPCILIARGTYKLMVLEAYQLNNGKLEKLWRWDGDEQNPIIRGQGAHSMISADIDGDGRDEVILGSVVIDDNGTALWSTGFGHPDRMFISDIDPTRPGLEIIYGIEDWHIDEFNGVVMVDAKTGKTLWNIGHPTYHIADVMVADIDPSIPGLEVMAWEDPKGGTAGASSDKYMLSADGQYLARNYGVPNRSDWVFWDEDLLRERIIMPSFWRSSGATIEKYGGAIVETEIEGRVLFIGDLFGDWREEIITVLPGEMRIYTTTIPARDRRITLMQDPIYRSTILHNSMGYSQSAVPGYYLGEDPNEAEKFKPLISK